jgi:hypothetical protein
MTTKRGMTGAEITARVVKGADVFKAGTRVKQHCMWRIESGARKGQLCGKPIGISLVPTDYCDRHHDAVMKRAQK